LTAECAAKMTVLTVTAVINNQQIGDAAKLTNPKTQVQYFSK